METAYLHLVTNHIPIIGIPFALAVLIIGIWRNSDEIKAWSFLIFAVLGLLTIGVYLLGQGGEDFVEELAGVSHDAIEDHEGVAKFALGSVLVTAAIAVFALVRYGGLRLLAPRFRETVEAEKGDAQTQPRAFPTWIVLSVLAIALVSSGILGYTGRLGGKIRHPEFHGGAQTTGNERNEAGETDEEGDEGDKGGGRNRGRR
jgi:amino acid transporter